jgi:hypothetical protein
MELFPRKLEASWLSRHTSLPRAASILMFLIGEYWLKVFVSMFPLHGILIAPS